MNMNKSFTLIELLVVLAIIAILAGILIITIKPTEIFRKARDTQRTSDLNNIDKLITIMMTEDQTFTELKYASSNVVYISLQDTSSTCGTYISQLPSLPSGWSYKCSATPTNIDGTGWIPIPFSSSSLINLSKLPIDPINKPPYYYSFVAGGSYELTAALENDSNKSVNGVAGKDGGTSWNVYEIGSNKKLTPLAVEDGGGRDKSLVGYWSFDEGTGTIAYDLSGNGNNGTLYNFNWTATSGWVDGKVGKALSFDGVDDYVALPNSSVLNPSNAITVIAWVKSSNSSYYPGWWQVVSNYNAYILGTSGYNNINMCFITVKPSQGSWGYGNCSNIPDPANWHFFAGLDDGSQERFYVDGVFKNSISWSGSINNGGGLHLGHRECCAEYFGGLIDEVRIYNRALSDNEIKALYEATR